MKTAHVAPASLLLAFGFVASASVPGARLLKDGHDGVLEDALSLAALQAPHSGWEWTPPPAGDPSKLCTAPGWMGPSSPEQWVPSGMTPWNRRRGLKSTKTPKSGTGKWRAPRPESDGSEICSAGAECQGYSMLKVASIEGEGGGSKEFVPTTDSDTSKGGVMFQIEAEKDIAITGFKLRPKDTGTTPVKVLHRAGSYADCIDTSNFNNCFGDEDNWDTVLAATNVEFVVNTLTEAVVLDSPVSAVAGGIHSFYIASSSLRQRQLSTMMLSEREFDSFGSDGDLEIFVGRGCSATEFTCPFHPNMIFTGAILYEMQSAPAPGSWTQFAMLAGQSGVRAYPGTTGDDLGTLENCQLAPVASKDELADMILEVRRIVVNFVLAEGGTVAEADDILENESFWLGVVKPPAQVAADNGGNGSRLGWKNLDGTPADVCDADWLGVGAGGGEQPDGSTDGALDTRLVLVDGQLKDYPDSGEDVVYAIYKCCMATIAFSSCDAVA